MKLLILIVKPVRIAFSYTCLLILLAGCTIGGTTTQPGLYECAPTNPLFQHLSSFRFDTKTADIRVALPSLDVQYFTTINGERVALRADDPARWKCTTLIIYDTEKE